MNPSNRAGVKKSDELESEPGSMIHFTELRKSEKSTRRTKVGARLRARDRGSEA